MDDVARHIGVSKATVSLAYTGNGRISPETRDAVLRAAEQLGFAPDLHARRLSKGRFDNLISLFTAELDMGTVTAKMSHIQRQLMLRGYRVSMHAFGFSPWEELQGATDLMRQTCLEKPRAIICHSGHLAPEALEELEKFQGEGGLVVCYGQRVSMPCDQVLFDFSHSARIAARHLLELGHRRIAIHPGRRRPRDPRYTSPRLEGFDQALAEWKISPRDKMVFYSEGVYEDAGVDVAAQFLALSPSSRPTGLIIANDRAAAAFTHTVLRAGVEVPGEVSVISDDDLPTARTCMVPLSATTHPVELIADAVVQTLEERLAGYDGEPRELVLHGELVQRFSVAGPPLLPAAKRNEPVSNGAASNGAASNGAMASR